jgi:DNA repair protein RadC
MTALKTKNQSDFYEIPVISLRMVRDGGILVQRSLIKSPVDIYNLLQERMQDLDREVMCVVHLDSRNKVLAIENAFVGTINSNHIRVADLMKGAILQNAAAILLAHNHPSGDPSPSPEDVAVTKAIKAGAGLLDIELLDHIIIGDGRFISLKERGLGFK